MSAKTHTNRSIKLLRFQRAFLHPYLFWLVCTCSKLPDTAVRAWGRGEAFAVPQCPQAQHAWLHNVKFTDEDSVEYTNCAKAHVFRSTHLPAFAVAQSRSLRVALFRALRMMGGFGADTATSLHGCVGRASLHFGEATVARSL